MVFYRRHNGIRDKDYEQQQAQLTDQHPGVRNPPATAADAIIAQMMVTQLMAFQWLQVGAGLN